MNALAIYHQLMAALYSQLPDRRRSTQYKKEAAECFDEHISHERTQIPAGIAFVSSKRAICSTLSRIKDFPRFASSCKRVFATITEQRTISPSVHETK
jgi:hypothetical protein